MSHNAQSTDDLHNASDRSWNWIPWTLVPLIFILFASHPTRRFYFDGVMFATYIEHGPWERLFNPHHLLYTYVMYILHNFFESVSGRDIKALYMMQWINIFLGSIGVALLWRLISRLVEDKGLALLVTLLGCFSFTWWHYSTDADVYIISTLFLLLAADRLETVIRHREPSNADFVVIGIFQALSVLFHQLNVFWVFCVMGCLIYIPTMGTSRVRWRWWWIYFISFLVPVAVAYLGVGIFALGLKNPGEFVYWITEYGHESGYWVSSWKEIPYLTLNGYLMAFFHRWALGPKLLEINLIQALEEGRFWKGILKKVLGYYSIGLLFYMYLAALYNLRKYQVQYPKKAVFCFSWLLPYVVFQLFFMPTNYFYKLFIFVPLLAIFAWYGQIVVKLEKKWIKWTLFLIFILGVATRDLILAALVLLFAIVFEIFQSRKDLVYRWGLFILVTFVGLYNFYAGIMPESKLANNPEVVQALRLDEYFKSGDMLIFEGGSDYIDGRIITALTEVDLVTLTRLYEMPESEFDSIIDSHVGDGGEVYIHPNITENTAQFREKVEESGVSQEELTSILDKYYLEPGFMLDGRIFYKLAGKEAG